MSYETIKLDIVESGQVGVLSISRPEAMNALNKQLLSELSQALTELESSTVRCLILTGEGKAFVAGADIKELQGLSGDDAYELSQSTHKLFSRLENAKFPVVAAVNGFALGGGLELALACDFIVASRKARLGLPEVGLGLIPGYGGTQRLSRSIGKNAARYLTLTGEMFEAEELYTWGLVSRVCEPNELMDVTLKITRSICQKGPLAVSLAKKAIHKGFNEDFVSALKLEAKGFSQAFESQDHAEGLSAFIEKRQPEFKGT